MAAEATGAMQGTAMEISVSKFELLKELTATQGVDERKTTIPILSNFLFEAADNRLFCFLSKDHQEVGERTSAPARTGKRRTDGPACCSRHGAMGRGPQERILLPR